LLLLRNLRTDVAPSANSVCWEMKGHATQLFVVDDVLAIAIRKEARQSIPASSMAAMDARYTSITDMGAHPWRPKDQVDSDAPMAAAPDTLRPLVVPASSTPPLVAAARALDTNGSYSAQFLRPSWFAPPVKTMAQLKNKTF